MTDPRPSPGQILKQLCPAGPLISVRRRPTGPLAGTVGAGQIIHTIRLITPAERAAAGLKPDQLVVELSDGTLIYPGPDWPDGPIRLYL